MPTIYPADAAALRQEQSALLTELREANPGLRMAASADGSSVGVWVDSLAMFRPVVMHACTGAWVWLDGHVPTINGERILARPEDWAE